jgi:hypothetical protein
MKPRYEEASSEAYEMLRKAVALEERLDTLEKTKIEKGSQHMEQSYGTTPNGSQFMIETGGQTYNNFYNTNQALLDSEDVTNKGASSESVNIDSTPMKNTHDTINRLVEG